MKDSNFRTLLKTIIWRIIASIASFAIAYFILNDISKAGSIAGIQVVIHTILYYLYERAWIKLCCN